MDQDYKEAVILVDRFNRELESIAKFMDSKITTDPCVRKIEFLFAMVWDGFRGVRACLKAKTLIGIASILRNLLEYATDTELLKKHGLTDYWDHASLHNYFLQRKCKSFRPITDMALYEKENEAILQKFRYTNDKGIIKYHDHWTKIPNFEQRCQNIWGSDIYDNVYRITSLATHGNPNFMVLAESFETLKVYSIISTGLAIDFTFKAIKNLANICDINDHQFIKFGNELKGIGVEMNSLCYRLDQERVGKK